MATSRLVAKLILKLEQQDIQLDYLTKRLDHLHDYVNDRLDRCDEYYCFKYSMNGRLVPFKGSESKAVARKWLSTLEKEGMKSCWTGKLCLQAGRMLLVNGAQSWAYKNHDKLSTWVRFRNEFAEEYCGVNMFEKENSPNTYANTFKMVYRIYDEPMLPEFDDFEPVYKTVHPTARWLTESDNYNVLNEAR